jgi:hypothetical protein
LDSLILDPLFQRLIDGFHDRDPRALVVDVLGVASEEYTASQTTYDPRRLRMAGRSPACSVDSKHACSIQPSP